MATPTHTPATDTCRTRVPHPVNQAGARERGFKEGP